VNISGKVSLEQLASVLYPGLTIAEKRVLQAVTTGATAFCGAVEDEENPPNPYPPENDPTKAATSWGADRNVRYELLHWLCTNPTAVAAIDPRGLNVCAARITGKVDFSYLTVAFPLSFERCVFEKNAYFNYLKAPVLSFTGSHMKEVTADVANVAGDVSFDEGFVSEGGVRMLTAQIGGSLECNGGTFRNPTKHALWADRVKIAGTAFLGKFIDSQSPFNGASFHAEGTVRLIGAQIGGVLECSGGSFSQPTRQGPDPVFALICDRMKVGSVFLRDAFSAKGEVRLWGADIGTNLICTDGTFSKVTPNPPPDPARTAGTNALSAHSAKIAGDVLLDGSFDGVVELPDIQVGGSVNCQQGSFTTLSLQRAVIKGSFGWSQVRNRERVHLDLTNATAGPLEDEAGSWPESGHLLLDGFCYSRISSPTTDVESRLRWLGLAPKFALQPFQQLAKVLKDSGDVDSPSSVLLKMEEKRHQGQDRGRLQRIGSWILHWTIGYGQKPLWALWWLLGLITLGFIFYGLGYLGGAIVPNDKYAYADFRKQGYTAANYTAFNPLIYSVENSFPVMTLGVKAQWQPASGAGPIRPALNCVILKCLRDNGVGVNSPGFLRVWLWLQTTAGWVLATLFVAGLTGIVKTG
jgi:hypothetical protein